MIGEDFKGDIKDVCAELEREAKRSKGVKMGEWLRRRKLEEVEAKQFGMPVEEFRKCLCH